jgi:hypothetical protein
MAKKTGVSEAEAAFIDKLATDLIGQLAPQLQALGHPSPVLLYGLSAAAAVVEVTAQRQLEQLKLEHPDRAAEFEQQWVRVLEQREEHTQRAREQALAAPLPSSPSEEAKGE